MTNSETNFNFSVSQIKSPSRLDSLSLFESSPNLKRIKVSEEVERTVSNAENFNLGESYLKEQFNNPPLRKSKRRKRKSKVMREATGEDEEIVITKTKRIKSKADIEINKIIELSIAAQKREEHIPVSKSFHYLVEYEYDYGAEDTTPV
mmetsp:Transcript_21913/g.19457  ORF Transcript_21913/g.19457 Transcript_21913/m.19457 type:complete len:149 (-) Transcript_21913:257-703(-)